MWRPPDNSHYKMRSDWITSLSAMAVVAALLCAAATAAPDAASSSAPPAAAPGPAAGVRHSVNFDQVDPSAGPVRRVVRLFDFEERELGNLEPMPMHWFRITGRGYPSYTDIGFDDTIAASKRHALRFQLNGGSAGVVLEPGVIAVVPGARYRVASNVRTQRTEHARARVVAEFIDADRKRIAPSRTVSEAVSTAGRWSSVSIDMPDAPVNAAWLILRLELVQADQHGDRSLGVHEVAEQDIDAAAWFDDVAVYQLPRIDLATQHAINVFRAPQRPKLIAAVHDLTGEQLTAVLSVYDASGRLVAEQKRSIADTLAGVWHWEPDLPAYGWYRADLEARSPRGVAGRAVIGLSYLPPDTLAAGDGADRFAIVAETLPPSHRELVAPLMERIGPQSVVLSPWRVDMTPQQMIDAADHVDPLILRLLDQGNAVTLSLAAVPRDLAAAAGTDPLAPLDLLARDPAIWRPHVEALLATHSQHIRNWQIGRASATEAFDRDDLPAVYARADALVRRFVADAHLALPWSALHQITPDAQTAAAITLDIPTGIAPQRIGEYARAWPTDRIAFTYLLRTLPPGRFAHEARATDLALRMVYAWRTAPYAMAIDRPWASIGSHGVQLLPDPLLGVWVAVAEQLAGRQHVGKLLLGDGIECDLFDGARGGVMVVWSDGSSPVADTLLDLHLGQRPIATDMYGNRHALSQRDGRHHLPLSTSPQFVSGIDMRIARFRAGFSVDPPLIPSIHAVHQRELIIRNPWPRAISGRLRITGPQRWQPQPQIHNFAIPGGGEVRLPVSFTFPINETAGDKFITARVALDADTRHEFDVAAPVTVGLEHIEFRSQLSTERPRDPNNAPAPPDAPADLVLTLTVTNTGDADDSFYAYAAVPGQPRQQRIVAPLKPGQSVVKRFRYPGLADSLSGATVRVGLTQTDGPAILNHELPVP